MCVMLPMAEVARRYMLYCTKILEFVDPSQCSIKQTIVEDNGLTDSGVYKNGTFVSVQVHGIKLAPH